jgi:L-rhamnose mutarotase
MFLVPKSGDYRAVVDFIVMERVEKASVCSRHWKSCKSVMPQTVIIRTKLDSNLETVFRKDVNTLP